MAKKFLRLSLFTLPEITIGKAPATPQNLSMGADRLEYLDGMIRYFNLLLQQAKSRRLGDQEIESIRNQVPYSELIDITNVGGKRIAREVPGARDRISFHLEHVKTVFPDGRNRTSGSLAIGTGKHTPHVAHVISRLSAGITGESLTGLLKGQAIDSKLFLDELMRRGLVEEVPEEDPVPSRLRSGHGDRLTWLGHAAALFQSDRTSICVDPYLRPHIRWKDEEIKTLFSNRFADSRLFDPYGPNGPQLSPMELPPLDAVLITHQDIDHCNLGVLMTLPEKTPIIVPQTTPNHPWEVDLKKLIHTVLGRKRKVVQLGHGKSMKIGEVTVTAFPFCHEMPTALKTKWNCYLLETRHSAVACTADSAVEDSSVEFLTEKLGKKKKPLTLCARQIHDDEQMPGYRDELQRLYQFTRLWGWYTPVWNLFSPNPSAGISQHRLARLVKSISLRFYLPYAMGSTPWFRMTDPSDPLSQPLANLSISDLDDVSSRLKAVSPKSNLFPGKFSEPVQIA